MGLVVGFFSLQVISEACHILAGVRVDCHREGIHGPISWWSRAVKNQSQEGRLSLHDCAPVRFDRVLGCLFLSKFHYYLRSWRKCSTDLFLSLGCSSFTGVIQSCPDPFCDRHWGLLSTQWLGAAEMLCLKTKPQEKSLCHLALMQGMGWKGKKSMPLSALTADQTAAWHLLCMARASRGSTGLCLAPGAMCLAHPLRYQAHAGVATAGRAALTAL